MKIRITGQMVITGGGIFSRGSILTSPPYTDGFLTHLVDDARAAEWYESPQYDTKVTEDYEVKKKPPSSQSLPRDQVRRKKTRSTRTKKAKSS